MDRISHPPFQAGDFACVQFREGKALAAEILQGSADQVNFTVVKNQESVMEVLTESDIKLRILRIELRDVRRKNLMMRLMGLSVEMLRGDNRYGYSLAFLREHVQCHLCRPVVYKEYGLPRARNQLFGQDERIPDLPVIKHTLQRRRTRLDEDNL